MWASVLDAFFGFNAPLEGVVNFLYLDVLGLVTTAVGVLVDPIGVALALPWVRPDGTRATQAEIAAAWHAVKARQDLKLRGGMAYKNVTTLRLTDEGLRLAVANKLDVMDRQLASRFTEYNSWPADAQLATLSMSWACGPHFRFPALAAALNARDFLTASNECRIREEGNPGVIPRNVRNKALYINAACAQKTGFSPETLFWPDDDAVRAFQLKAGLVVDGVVGPKTLAALAAKLPA